MLDMAALIQNAGNPSVILIDEFFNGYRRQNEARYVEHAEEYFHRKGRGYYDSYVFLLLPASRAAQTAM